MKCLTGNCSKQAIIFHLYKQNTIIPADCEVGVIRKLCAYFQYEAPNIDSAQSPMLDLELHDQTLQAILTTFKNNYEFYPQNAKPNIYETLALSGDNICASCKRFICKKSTSSAKRDKTRKETDLECLLRHIRNAIAHGNVYLIQNKTYIYICLEDMTDSKSKNTTARIVVTQADLKKWKIILEKALKDKI